MLLVWKERNINVTEFISLFSEYLSTLSFSFHLPVLLGERERREERRVAGKQPKREEEEQRKLLHSLFLWSPNSPILAPQSYASAQREI